MTSRCNRVIGRAPIVVLSTLAAALPAQSTLAPFDAAHIAFPADTSIRCLTDLDGDGHAEAVGLWNYPVDGEVRISGFQADAQGAFTRLWSFQAAFPGVGGVPDMVAGDVDGDGHPDLAVVFHGIARVFATRGLAQPVEWSPVPVSGVSRVVLGDFDGDGRRDLAGLTSNSFGQSAVQVWRNTGSGFVSAGSVAIPSSSTPGWLELTEVNGDGIADVLVATSTRVWLVRMQAGAPLVQSIFDTTVFDIMPCSGDVDGDGDEDIVLFGHGQYQLLRRTGSAAFTLEPWHNGGPATNLLDVDGDGDLDGICCGGGGGGPGLNTFQSTFEVAINQGGGVFAPAIAIPGLGTIRVAGAVDVDGDGRKDLIAGRAIYYARGPWTPPTYRQVPLRGALSNALVDIDRDGDPDGLPGVYGMLRNDGAAGLSFAMPVLPVLQPGTWWYGPGFIGDFDGDSAPDLIVSHVQGPTYAPQLISMRLLRNAGGGGFVDGGPAAAPGVNMNVATWEPAWDLPGLSVVGDLDNDGDLDLVVNGAAGTNVAIAQAWINDGHGYFTAGTRWLNVTVQAIVDLDGDRVNDLVTTDGFYTDTAALTLRRGLGNGSFGGAYAPLVVTLGHGGRAAIVDWDGDGDLDVVGGVDAAWHLSVLLNNGGFQFAAAATMPGVGRDGARSSVLAEVNGDGRPDLVIYPWTLADTGAGILLQQPGGGFQLWSQQVLGPSEFADLDGDGDDDTFRELGVVRNFAVHGVNAGRRQQYGDAFAGSGGMPPVLGARGPFRVGRTADTRLTGAVGGGLAVFLFGAEPADLRDVPVPGMSLYIAPPWIVIPVALAGAPGAPGAGSVVLPYAVTPSLAGVTIYKQVLVVDLGMPNYLAASNGLAIHYGL